MGSRHRADKDAPLRSHTASFSPRATAAFHGWLAIVLLSLISFAGPASADDQPVEPFFYFRVVAGPQFWDLWYETPEEAFAAYKADIEPSTGWTLSNFGECTRADLAPNLVHRVNERYGSWYCHTQNYNNGTAPVRTMAVGLVLPCPRQKPARNVTFPPSNPPGYDNYTASCLGSTPQPSPEDCTHECGNPIQVETRIKIERATDVAIDDLLRFDRTYTSSGGDWQHNYSVRAWNLSRNAMANIANNPSPARFVGTIDMPGGQVIRRSLPYMSSADINRPATDDLIAIRPDGGTDVFSSITGRSGIGTNDKARVLVDGSNQYAGLVVEREKGVFEEFDREGRLLKRTRLNGSGVVLTYLGPSGQRVPASAPACAGVSSGPQTAGNPSCVTDTITGRQLVFTYGAEKLLSVVEPSGHSVNYVYDGSTGGPAMAGYHPLTAVNYPDSAQKVYHYNEQSLTAGVQRPTALTGVTDENSNRYSYFSYGTDGRAVSTAHSNGVYAYTLSGSVLTDPLGAQRTFSSSTYTKTLPGGWISSSAVMSTGITKPNSSGSGTVSSSISRDSNGLIQSERDYRGIFTTYSYDLTRNLETQRVEANGTPVARTVSTRWHPDWRLAVQIAEPKRMTWSIYNGQPDPTDGNVILTCAPSGSLIDSKPIAVLCKQAQQATLDTNGSSGFSATLTSPVRSWTYTYNSDGQMLTADGPRTDVSDVTSYAYYSSDDASVPQQYRRGDLHTITNAAGHVTTFSSYNANGRPLTITDPNGVVVTLTYDLRQRLLSRTIGTEQTSFTYWPTGLLKKATLPDGSYLEFSYDAAHRLTGINDAEGNTITYTLDAMGNRTGEQVFDPSSALTQTRSQVFSTLNNLQKEIGAAGTTAVTTEYGYDNNRNPTSIAAPLSRSSAQTYDALNRLATVTDPASGVTQYGYNGLDQLISVTDPRGKVTSYTYNGLGDETQLVSPDTGTTTNTYDSAGNLATQTDARGKVGTYSYDALNRVTQLSFPDQTLTYTYDAGANATGRLSSLTDSSGSTAWAYDAMGRATSHQQTVGSLSKTTGYSHSSAGLLQTMTLPSGNIISYGYQNGRMASLTLNGSTTILSDVLYQPFGPTTGWTWGNSTLAVREYDTDGKVTDIDSAGLKTYAYDDAFRVTGITDAGNSSFSQGYGYDLLDRLTSATGTGLNQSWTYDANGNRLTQGGSQASTFTVSSTSNRLNSVSGSLTRTYSYDAAGNTTGDGTATYAYDDAGRMITATKSSVTGAYGINARGQRVKKTAAGVVTYFTYDEEGHLTGEYDSAGNLLQETVWLEDIPVATLRPNGSGGVNLFYIHTDHLNTPRRISRPSDNVVVWRWDSDPFGTTAANQDPDGDSVLFGYNLRFPGQYFDAESELHYNYFRDYDPGTGRYAQSDPIGLSGGLNTYSYVGGDPLTYSDETGEFANVLIGAATGVISGYLIATLTGDECYGLSDALQDAALGAVGAGIVSKINKLNRIRKLKNIANDRGLRNAGRKGYTETWKDGPNNAFEKLDIKYEAGKSANLQKGSKVPRFSYRVDAGKFWNPFTGQTGPKGDLSHIPLEPLIPYGAGAAGAGAGALREAGCGCAR